jgi:hypothetical protein
MRIATQDAAPASGGSHESWWGTAEVLIKPTVFDHPRRVANEFVATRLAAAIGIPVPLGEVGIDVEQRVSWLSGVIRLPGGEVAPEDPRALLSREPDICAGTFVFDTWIFNEDRHDENIIYHPSLGIWLIDHDQAFGGTDVPDASRLGNLANSPLAYHMFSDEVLRADYMRSWGCRVQSVPQSAILRIMSEVERRGLVTRDQADHLGSFVLERRSSIHTLVRRSVRSNELRVSLEVEPETPEGGGVA